MTILTLIAARRLTPSLINQALAALSAAGISAAFDQWIDEGDAADLIVEGEGGDIRTALEGRLAGVDIIPHGAGPRRKTLLIADMDSTMIGQECIDELADYAGVRAKVAAVTEAAMRGEIDFVGALQRRVALLAGLDVALVHRCLRDRVRPTPGGATLVATMRHWGATTLLVSGGFTLFTRPVGAALGFDRVHANQLEVADGRLTGRCIGQIVDSGVKRAALEAALADGGWTPADALAMGDGANDAQMVVAAGMGIAFRAKPALAAVASARLDHHPLDALLWAQGVSRAQWSVRPDPGFAEAMA